MIATVHVLQFVGVCLGVGVYGGMALLAVSWAFNRDEQEATDPLVRYEQLRQERELDPARLAVVPHRLGTGQPLTTTEAEAVARAQGRALREALARSHARQAEAWAKVYPITAAARRREGGDAA